MTINLVITGFSSFHGVTKNPTEELVDKIEEYLAGRGKPFEGEIVCTEVLRVSAKDVDSWLRHAHDIVEKTVSREQPVIWVHLGVDAQGQYFKLETQAFNEATFRIPDEDGWQPSHEKIDKQQPYDQILSTDLPLPAIQEHLQKAHHNVHLSEDAGRYLCNMIYYKSLRQSYERFSTGDDRRWHSLFVHVPPFVRIEEEEQLAFLSNLLDQLSELSQPKWERGGLFRRLPAVAH